MDPIELALRILESEAPSDAVQTSAELMRSSVPLRYAAWIGADGTREAVQPAGATPPDLPLLNSDGDVALRQRAEEDLLVIPLEGAAGTLLFSMNAGRFSPAAVDARRGEWKRVAKAFSIVVQRERASRAAHSEREELRQRAEESEALHALGLSANRSLDPAEVLELVARVARTLLGAHYVTVSMVSEGSVASVSSAGLRASDAFADGDRLARLVIERGVPVTVGQADSTHKVEEFPFHLREGMEAALGVPLSLFGSTFGALVAGYRRPYALAPRDTRFALTLAGHAAVAINNAQLHSAIGERSRELERAYEELRWTSQAKERFFASMSHELRTPLNAVLGYQSLLLEEVPGPLPFHVRTYLEKAHRASHNLLTLVNDVLDLAKIEAGKVDLIIREMSLGEVIEDAVLNVQPLAQAKGLTIEVAAGSAPATIQSDPERLGQILRNLLSNAVKFTQSGGIVIRAAPLAFHGRRASETGTEQWVEIGVSDTGSGVAEEDQERIFHEFEQVTGSASRGGTGLGLPISRKLARLLGGDLTVESEVGRGSTFLLRLPERPPQRIGTTIAADAWTQQPPRQS